MKYAIDASVALKWVLPEIDSDKVLCLRIAFLRLAPFFPFIIPLASMP